MESRVSNTRFTTKLRTKLESLLQENGLRVAEYIGYKNDRVDFVLTDGKTLSVKTNLQSDKVCPQVIGQTTQKKFCSFFNISTESPPEIKQWIYTHIAAMLPVYFNHTFCCDYLLWVNETTAECKLIAKPDQVNFPNISFTRALSGWNESNTVKIRPSLNTKPVSIGEFQFHRNRNCIKFRFNLLPLLKLIK